MCEHVYPPEVLDAPDSEAFHGSAAHDIGCEDRARLTARAPPRVVAT